VSFFLGANLVWQHSLNQVTGILPAAVPTRATPASPAFFCAVRHGGALSGGSAAS